MNLASLARQKGISYATLSNWRNKLRQQGQPVPGNTTSPDSHVRSDRRLDANRPEPKNKLSTSERERILEIGCLPEYASLPPSQIVPLLLDKGVYLASEASFYRVLKANNQLHRRGRSRQPRKKAKPLSYTASGPNQVWSWDITYLASRVKGQFYYLYLFEDIYSRKIVGYEVHQQECGKLASELVQRCMFREQCFRSPLVLHSYNGAPMTAQTMKAKLEELGIISSYSRPRVSNDNPYSEALFRTLKYRADWPSTDFDDLDKARDWLQGFVSWYNNDHKHSKINFVTPSQRHAKQDRALLARRKIVLKNNKATMPSRWSGSVRNCEPVGVVSLNPDKPDNTEMKAAS